MHSLPSLSCRVHLRPPDIALFSFLFGKKILKLKEKRKEDRVKENKTGQMEKTSKTKLKKYSKNYLSSYSCTVHILSQIVGVSSTGYTVAYKQAKTISSTN